MKNKLLPSKVISQKTVFKSRYFRVDQVGLEIKGNNITKDIIRRNPSVFILALDKDDQIYLVSQYRDALRSESLEVIAGTAEETEDFLAAAKRELEEETGLKAKEWKKLASAYLSANMTAGIHFFLAEDLEQGAAEQDPDEDIRVVKMPFKEAVEKVMTGEIKTNPSISAILLLDKIRRKT